MEFTDQHANKENMARILESAPSPRTACSGIAERRMQALREQQRQELFVNQEASRASKSEESMDVDTDMDECMAPSPIQEKNYSRYNDNDVSPGTNDVDRRVKLHSNFAERLDRVEEKMDCSSEGDILPSTDDVNRRVKQHSNFAEGLDQDTQYDFYVVDTCVYIDALEGVEELLMYCLDDENHSVVVVPYQILQELDHLKEKKPELVDHVDAAVRFIRNNLESEQRAMKAQHTSDYMERLAAGFSGDDSILDCALQLREQVPNVGTITMKKTREPPLPKARVIAVTRIIIFVDTYRHIGLAFVALRLNRLNCAVMQSLICEEVLYGYQAGNYSEDEWCWLFRQPVLCQSAQRIELGQHTCQWIPNKAPSQYSSSAHQQQQRSSDMCIDDWKLWYERRWLHRGQPGLRGQGKDIPRFSRATYLPPVSRQPA